MKKHYQIALLWSIFTITISLLSQRTAQKLFVVDFFGVDKLAHLMVYFILTWLWIKAFVFTFSYQNSFLRATIVSATIGIAMEICQKYFTEGRQFEYDDIVANLTGTIFALVIYYVINKKKLIIK